MTPDPKLSRRSLLAASAALPLVAGLTGTARAGGHAAPPNSPKHSFAVGDFQVSTMLAGTRVAEDPMPTIAANADPAEFAAVAEEFFIPTDKMRFYFTPTVVNTGSEVVLFDTGLSAAGTLPALEASGLTAADVDIVVITHMHGDHIGGLTLEDGTPTYPNARYVTGQAEFDHWAGAANDNFDAKMRPLAEKTTFIGDEASVAPGITSVAAFGHTPGHMVYRLESDGEQLLILADLAAHYVWSFANPDWELRFDNDKSAAAATRRRVLDMAAADRLPIIGYHLPFPAVGYVDTHNSGFRFVPATYQLML